LTAVATVPAPTEAAKPPAIIALLTSPAAAQRIAPFLPEGVNVERVAAAAQLAVMQMPAIGECDPKSIVLAVAKIAQWGLDIGTTAHLVPFNTKVGEAWVKVCTPVPDYRGMVEMIVRSGAARSVEARVVREGDSFRYAYGTQKFIEHIPTAKSTARITHAYAIANLRFQAFDFVVLDRDEIEAVRGKSKQWAKGELEACAWYAKKTAVRRVVNLIPKNPKLAEILTSLEEIPEAEFTSIPADRDPDGPTPARLPAPVGTKANPTPLASQEYPANMDRETGEDLGL
jgi:phage RecT family recombinase